MSKFRVAAAAAISFAALAFLDAPASHAQNLQLGGSFEQTLEANGYRDIKVTQRRLTITQGEACKGGKKYRVKVNVLGVISSAREIGSCAQEFGGEQAIAVLRRRGYTDIEARRNRGRIEAAACKGADRVGIVMDLRGRVQQERKVGRCGNAVDEGQLTELMEREGFTRVKILQAQTAPFLAQGCRNDDRIKVVISRRGRIRNQQKIGECRQRIDPANLASILEEDGLRRVKIVQGRRAPFLAEACRENARVELVIGRFGRIQSETTVGRCRRDINPKALTSLIQKNGFNRIRILNDRSPPYLAEACRKSDLIELVIGRRGKIRSQERIGTCRVQMSGDQISQKLRDEGYMQVNLERDEERNWRGNICKQADKIAIRVNVFGDVLSARKIGACRSESVLDVLTRLEGRGAEQTELFVEGCFRNTKYRWAFDRLGNRINRTRIGGC